MKNMGTTEMAKINVGGSPYTQVDQAGSVSLEQTKRSILAVLMKNLENPHPEVVRTTDLADSLGYDIDRTRAVLNILEKSGLSQTDIEGECSIITCEGLRWARGYCHQ